MDHVRLNSQTQAATIYNSSTMLKCGDGVRVTHVTNMPINYFIIENEGSYSSPFLLICNTHIIRIESANEDPDHFSFSLRE